MRWASRGALVGLVGLALGAFPRGLARADGPVTRSSRVSRPTTPAGYFYNVRYLHSPTPGHAPPLDASGKPQLVIRSVNLQESQAFTMATDQGGFDPYDLPRVSQLLREAATGHQVAFEPRLFDILYRIQRHFNAQEIRVISSYRTPVEGNGQGNHGKGRAVDFVVPGADDVDVARFARELGFVGVGLYPIGSFVHVDVRARSYFWADRSGPGHQSRERGILPELAAHSDEAARARGERPEGETADSEAADEQ